MQNIEPFYRWRNAYIAEEDEKSPFFGREYSEFEYTNRVYNYYIHPQWDNIGSNTLYIKILFADYDKGFAIIELMGEWNDCIDNDIMSLKRNIIDKLLRKGIYKFVMIAENVLNFHSDDDCYYEEWYEEVKDEDGWITVLNMRQHIIEEMQSANLQYYLSFGGYLNQVNWRALKPQRFFEAMDKVVGKQLYLD
ncbi:MAG: hypothetical protein ACPGVB_04535 [Chitinophagales bacterium]